MHSLRAPVRHTSVRIATAPTGSGPIDRRIDRPGEPPAVACPHVGNALLGNVIPTHGGGSGLGIDLGGNGPTANNRAGHTGPNNCHNFPVPTSAARRADGGVALTFPFGRRARPAPGI